LFDDADGSIVVALVIDVISDILIIAPISIGIVDIESESASLISVVLISTNGVPSAPVNVIATDSIVVIDVDDNLGFCLRFLIVGDLSRGSCSG
jgi:hypothetical protein